MTFVKDTEFSTEALLQGLFMYSYLDGRKWTLVEFSTLDEKHVNMNILFSDSAATYETSVQGHTLLPDIELL